MSHNAQEIDTISLLRTYLFLPCFSFPRLSTFSKTASPNTAANYFGDIYIVRIQIADGSNELITLLLSPPQEMIKRLQPWKRNITTK